MFGFLDKSMYRHLSFILNVRLTFFSLGVTWIWIGLLWVAGKFFLFCKFATSDCWFVQSLHLLSSVWELYFCLLACSSVCSCVAIWVSISTWFLIFWDKFSCSWCPSGSFDTDCLFLILVKESLFLNLVNVYLVQITF